MEMKFFQKPTMYVKDVSINVLHLDRSLQFYVDFLGFQVIEKTKRKAVLSADGTKRLLTLVQPKDVLPKESRTTGLYHFAILLPSREDLGSFLSYIAKSNIQIGASDHYVSEAIYLSDPDGNGIEVYRDRPASEWNWQDGFVEMATVPIDAQGVLSAKKKEWEGMPEDTIIGHIHLHVADLESAKEFYVNGLGLDVVTTYPGALFLSHGGYHHHVGLNVWNGIGAKRPLKNSVGLVNYRFAIPDENSLAQIVEKVEKIGVPISMVEENKIYETEDPSGNKIVLSVE